MKSEVKKYLQKIGKTGGIGCSDRKRVAIRRNLEKAWKATKAKKIARNAKLGETEALEKP